ncbi:DNA-binding MarR family transcriptional regulator [Kribbella voronezhensis]|uniref:DNA-binding MarR family transcriptional regulator n=1 Tax=Kribbella voronezhensis TaxID=2512212 RepID=A0A4R7SWG9_9ACTN|nr:MarR family transcriptional regulator [Kribbella voronezhensis]TDU83571.1 DNA-binding MarR family transcriptional regulator [Kribbella voronezhensis]
MKDFIDDHIDLWARELPEMDLRVEAVATRLHVLTKYLDRRRDAVLAGHGLQWWEFKTLHMLRRGGSPYRATPGELASQLNLSPATLTNRLDALVRQGYVVRENDRDDRRKVVAMLTEAGLEIWQQGIGDISRVEQELVGELSRTEQDQLIVLLRRLVLATDRP